MQRKLWCLLWTVWLSVMPTAVIASVQEVPRSPDKAHQPRSKPRLIPPPPPPTAVPFDDQGAARPASSVSTAELRQVAQVPAAPAVHLMPPTEQDKAPGLQPQVPEQSTELDTATGQPYVLGRGDSIRITDYSGRDLQNMLGTQIQVVQEDGTVSVYPVGVVRVAGKTIQQLTDVINERARKYIIDPQLLVSLMRARPVVVYVLGEVENPGVYSLTTPSEATPIAPVMPAAIAPRDISPILPAPETPGEMPGQVSAEINTLLIALQKAGGLRETANIRDIRISRPRTHEVIHADLWKLLVEGDASQDVALGPQDTVFVPPGVGHYDPTYMGRVAANHVRQVRVWGSVKAPGLYSLTPQDDVLSVIAKAGGFTINAYKGHVLLSRVNPNGTLIEERVSIPASLKSQAALGRQPIQAGDVIIASDNPILSVGKPAAKGVMIAGLAFLVLLLGSQIRNVNTTSGNNNNTRVLAFP